MILADIFNEGLNKTTGNSVQNKHFIYTTKCQRSLLSIPLSHIREQCSYKFKQNNEKDSQRPVTSV